MDAAKRKRLEASGWKFGDAAAFLRMTDEERQLLNARVDLAMAVRRQRESQGLSQRELADRIHTSQPRIAKIERAATDVSLDQLVRAFTAAGGRISFELIKEPSRSTAKPSGARSPERMRIAIKGSSSKARRKS